MENIVARKLKLQLVRIFFTIPYNLLIITQEREKANIRQPTIKVPDKILTPLSISPQNLPVSKEVLDTLYSIKTTPFGHSFLSRLRGFRGFVPPGLVAVDWEIRTPWMNVMADIREHYLFAQSVYIFFFLRSIAYSLTPNSALNESHQWKT
jgi:hypothetical protein